MTNTHFICATQGKKEDTLLYKWISALDFVKLHGNCYLYNREHHISVNYYENNKKPLSNVYNSGIQGVDSDYPGWIVFIHDDVMINCNDIFERLMHIDQHTDYDVIGLAGAKTITPKKPALWHLMSKREDWRGSVAHYHPNSEEYCVTSFGKLNDRVLVVDGLFIAIKSTSITPEIRFDENNTGQWHLYDMDFCLTCNKYKKKIGVVDIPVIHKSPGLLSLEDECFLKSEEWFLNKWNNA